MSLIIKSADDAYITSTYINPDKYLTIRHGDNQTAKLNVDNIKNVDVSVILEGNDISSEEQIKYHIIGNDKTMEDVIKYFNLDIDKQKDYNGNVQDYIKHALKFLQHIKNSLHRN